jgi:hypothetical protein
MWDLQPPRHISTLPKAYSARIAVNVHVRAPACMSRYRAAIDGQTT